MKSVNNFHVNLHRISSCCRPVSVMMRILFLPLILLCQETTVAQQAVLPPFVTAEARFWADSLLSTMSVREKVGQLFMIDAFSNKDSFHVAEVTQLIDSFNIGGLIFFQGGPVRQAGLTNFYQKRSKYPLLIGIDGEWGLNMRLDSTIRFPRQMTLSAGADEQDVYRMGAEIARQCKRLGIHINFAPDIDINNNPSNPIISSRSFGEDRETVARYGLEYMKGMQDNRVLACGKHFPGHGDTDSDSHHTLPVVTASLQRLDSLELYPFRKLIREGLSSIMVAHLFVPGIDTTQGLASTLSSRLVNGLLKDSLRFEGLVITDALNMKGVANYYSPGDLELKALFAGNDILLYSEDIPVAVNRIEQALTDGELELGVIEAKVRKILMAKYWAGLDKSRLIDTADIIAELNADSARWMSTALYGKSSTLLRNKGSILPMNPWYRDCIAAVCINDTMNNPFHRQLSAYAHVEKFSIPRDASPGLVDSVFSRLKEYDRVIVSLHNTTINAARNFGLTEQMQSAITRFGTLGGSVLVVFGNAYVLGRLEGLGDYRGVIHAYEDARIPQQLLAQKIFGASGFQGHLPVTVPGRFARGEGIRTASQGLLEYTMPEEFGWSSTSFSGIDSMVTAAIADSVMPGCQVLVAHKGHVIYDKSFGWHTYERQIPVSTEDVYDLASVTKIASTALAAMYLVEKKKLNPDAKASRYVHSLRKTNKQHLTIRQLMTHEAGLKAWIPFWKETVDSSGLMEKYYRRTPVRKFTLRVADSLYINDHYPEVIHHRIAASEVRNSGEYVYSDLSVLILQQVIEKISGKPLDELVQDVFYRPMGLWSFGYHPMNHLPRSHIVPTERDSSFRRQLIHGHVHDPAAAMLGGVAGNAGVFGNASSLAVIMQMLLNEGTYGGIRYLNPETVRLFVNRADPDGKNRRGLLFDKPDVKLGENGPTAVSASEATFGHTGFTGTCAWADPERELVYIFLSNRVHPSASNNKLLKTNLRTRIMQAVYDAMDAGGAR